MAQNTNDDIQYCGFNIYRNLRTGETFEKAASGELKKKSSLASEAERRFIERHMKEEEPRT